MATNATTTPSDVFQPQVVADIVEEVLYTRVPLLRSRAVYNANSQIWNDGGSTVTFPKWNTDVITDIEVQTAPLDRTKANTDKVTMTSTTETIVNKLIGIDIQKYTRRDILKAGLSLDAHIANVVADRLGATLQSALITEAESSALAYTAAGNITFLDLMKARSLWGDYINDGGATLVVPSEVFVDLVVLDEVKKIGDFGTRAGGPAVGTGQVLHVAGMDVIVSDEVSYYSGDGTFQCLILGPESLGLFVKQELEEQSNAIDGTLVTEHLFDFRFATHLAERLPAPVIEFNCSASLGNQ